MFSIASEWASLDGSPQTLDIAQVGARLARRGPEAVAAGGGGNPIGIFLRDVSFGTAEGNHAFGNCSGSTPVIRES